MKNIWMKHSFVFSLVALLSACGGTGQDDGSVSSFEQDYSGVVIDGYLARATVFLDTNNNGTRNSWEPFAFTDNDGYFSYNPLTDTNYCAAGASAELAQYCLTTNVSYSNVVIRIDSGYDVLTGEPFSGQMSRRLSAVSADSTPNTLVSPLTSLITNIDSTTDQGTVLSSLGLIASDLDVNYLSETGNDDVNANLLNAALKVHKVVTVLADRITDTYDEIGDEVGTPNDATSVVYEELALQLISSETSFDATIASNSAMASVLDNTETQIQQLYQDNEFDLPADLGSTLAPSGFSRVIDVANDIVDVVNVVVDVTDTDIDRDEAVGQTRAIESLVIKALDESSDDSTIDNAADFFTDVNNAALIDSLITSLSADTGDASVLAENDFTGTDFDSVDEIESAAQLSSDAAPFTEIAGFQLRVSDLDLGSAPSDLDDAEIEWYFNGSPGDLSGTFSACVKYIEGASLVALGDGNTRGEIVNGFWSLLGATQDSASSFSLLITLTFLETTYQAIMKPAGFETISNIEYEKIRIDNLDEINVWHSEFGLIATESAPTTDAECQARLPSRVGL